MTVRSCVVYIDPAFMQKVAIWAERSGKMDAYVEMIGVFSFKAISYAQSGAHGDITVEVYPDFHSDRDFYWSILSEERKSLMCGGAIYDSNSGKWHFHT